MKRIYTPEHIEYVQKYPYTVREDFLNGVQNDLVFKNKWEAEAYIMRMQEKSKRASFMLIKNTLLPEYMPERS